MSRVRLFLLAAFAAFVSIVVACSRDATSRGETAQSLMVGAVAGNAAPAPPTVPPARDEGRAAAFTSVRTTSVENRQRTPRPSADASLQSTIGISSSQGRVTPSMVVRNGDVSIQVDSVDLAVASVRQLAANLGGYVGNVALYTGENQLRSASIEMKIPVQRFDDAMSGVRPLGKVERSGATAEDVGEEFVDISARVTNAKRLEARLVDLLATRTGKLDDVLAVERELARVREEIERYEGRIRYLTARVAMSTIAVVVHEKAPIVAATPGTNVLTEAFRNMWRNFVRVIAAGIESLGVLVPLALLLGVAYWAVRRSGVTLRRGLP